VKVLGIVGSMRKKRNTQTLVQRVVSEMAAINSEVTSELSYASASEAVRCVSIQATAWSTSRR